MKKNGKGKYSDDELDKYFSDKGYRQKTKKKKNTKNKVFGTAIIAALVSVILLSVYLSFLSSTLPSLEELENPKLEEATKIFSSDGELIDKFFLQNRTKVTLDSIPKDMINALIATEDRKFYDH